MEANSFFLILNVYFQILAIVSRFTICAYEKHFPKIQLDSE